MSDIRSFSDKTKADDKSIGFDFQYYYFLYRILNLKTGQTVGLEVKDDVHSELDADFNILFQIKHTVKKNAEGGAIALTELDTDLWKTMRNWSEIIIDKSEGRTGVPQQLDYVRKTEFHLVTNKSLSTKNEFIAKIVEFQDGMCDVNTLQVHLKYLEEKTEDDTIKGYIRTVAKLEKTVLDAFLRHLKFELEVDDIIQRCKQALREKIIAEDKIDFVFERLDSNIRSENFFTVKNGESIVISFEQFSAKYRRLFDGGRSKQLQYYQFSPEVPADIFAQRFIKRLVEIEDISPDDEEDAVEYTRHKLRMTTLLSRWVQAGDLVQDEVMALHEDVVLRWRNNFRGAFKKCTNSAAVIEVATAILKTLRNERFQLSADQLPTELSNGELYHLSDIGRIGWHQDWKEND
ncbi:ABC-three component system protein [Comamonas sp. wu1-DMT]|uniref:dsDNA nuclease domain-containing protein n=1 Tax=Comamonas sp. wu1-DMT TaxID=3126390 RepID=UPI0032E44546